MSKDKKNKPIKVKTMDPVRDGIPEGTTTGPLKYLGTDHHSRKIMEGKFSSNVAPKNFGRAPLPKQEWGCDDKNCAGPHRHYLVKCDKCGMRRPF
jgi:hypothetical protein